MLRVITSNWIEMKSEKRDATPAIQFDFPFARAAPGLKYSSHIPTSLIDL